jgi:hypothetical protein
MPYQPVELDSIISNHVLRWSNLRVLECREVADAILHISRMSTLTHLSFTLGKETPDQILPSDFVLVFPNLSWCEITSGWLLPAANPIRSYPTSSSHGTSPSSRSKQTIRSFMTALKNMCSSGTLTQRSLSTKLFI